jgi:hypothetical protein
MSILHPFKGKSGTQIASYVLFFLSALILGGTVFANLNADVLKNWRLVLPEQQIRVGDEVVVQSLYEKVRNSRGVSVRYIECRNETGVFIRYPISEAVANRDVGKAGTGVVFVVPSTIPNIPAKCRFNITIDYEVYRWRHVIESTNSAEFTLYGKESNSNDESSETSRTKFLGDNQSSYSNDTPQPEYAQRNISQGKEITTPERPLEPTPQPVPEPGLLQRILSPVTNLLKEL